MIQSHPLYPFALQGNICSRRGIRTPNLSIQSATLYPVALYGYLCSLSDSNRHPFGQVPKTCAATNYAKGACVGMVGVEPTRSYDHTVLNRARLPVTPHPLLVSLGGVEPPRLLCSATSPQPVVASNYTTAIYCTPRRIQTLTV